MDPKLLRRVCQRRSPNLKSNCSRTPTGLLISKVQNKQIDSKSTSFYLFPRLPSEIQDLIWWHALPDPRVIEFIIEPLEPCLVSERSYTPCTKWCCRGEDLSRFAIKMRRRLHKYNNPGQPFSATTSYLVVSLFKVYEKHPIEVPAPCVSKLAKDCPELIGQTHLLSNYKPLYVKLQ